MPHEDHHHDVLNAHSLQQAKQFLTAAILIAIIISFRYIGGGLRILEPILVNILIPLHLWLFLVITWCNPVSNYAWLGLLDVPLPLNVAQYQINMVLIADGRRVSLVLCPVNLLHLSKTYGVQHRFHLFKSVSHLVHILLWACITFTSIWHYLISHFIIVLLLVLASIGGTLTLSFLYFDIVCTLSITHELVVVLLDELLLLLDLLEGYVPHSLSTASCGLICHFFVSFPKNI